MSVLHQGTKGTTHKQSAIQQHSNCFTVGSASSSATVILLGGIVGAPAYLGSSAVDADKPPEDTFFVLQGLVRSPLWGALWSWLIINLWCWVPGGSESRESRHLCHLLAKWLS